MSFRVLLETCSLTERKRKNKEAKGRFISKKKSKHFEVRDKGDLPSPERKMPSVQGQARYQGWPVFTNDGVGVGVGVVITRVELYDLVKTVF